MNGTRKKHHLHAEVKRTDQSAGQIDDAKAGFPLERRMHRMERVAASYRGQIERRFDTGLLITFDTAEAAMLAACEMQHRCAGLPHISSQKLTLRIGIHCGVTHQRSEDTPDNASEIAALLATIDDGVVISEIAAEELSTELRKLTRPLDAKNGKTIARQIDWRAEIPSATYSGESFWPASMGSLPGVPCLRLHYGLKTIELTINNPLITIGRDPTSDLVLNEDHISRNHCHIEIRANQIFLTDTSTNGTTVRSTDGGETLIKRKSIPLKGKGLLFPGRPFQGERRGGIKFETT